MNFCFKCGKELTKDAKFCQSCGADVLKMEEAPPVARVASPAPDTVQRTKPKNKFSKKWMIIAVVAVLFIGGGSALGINLLKNPKTIFLLAESNSYKQMSEDWNEKYGEDMAFQEKLLATPSSSEIKLSGNLDIDSEYSSYEYDMMQEFLEQAALVVKTDQDPTKNESHHNLALEVDGATAIDVELVQTKSQAGLKIPMLYDQFFYLNFDQYGELMTMIDPYYEGPETLEMGDFQWDELKLSEKEIASIKERYSSFLLEELNEDNFTLEKNVGYEAEGENFSLREITFELSPSETEDFINKFYNQLIEDDELHSLIADRFVKFAETVATTGEFDEELTKKSYVKKQLKSGLKDMKKEASQFEYPDGFKYVLLIDKDEQILDRQIKFAVEEEYLGKYDIDLTTKNIPVNKNETFKEAKLEITPADSEEEHTVLGYTNTITTDKNQRTEDLKVNLFFKESGYVEMDSELAVKSVFDGKSSAKQSIEREFELLIEGDEYYGVPMISGSINQDKDISVKDKYSNQSFDIEVFVQDEYEPGTVSLSVDSKTKLNNKIDLPKLDSSEGQNVVELTEDDMYDILEEMEYRLGDTLEELGLY